MIKENPHKIRRKELEKQREADLITPLDARNSLLMGGTHRANDGKGYYHPTATHEVGVTGGYDPNAQYPLHHMTPAPEGPGHFRTGSAASKTGLVGAAVPMGYAPGNHGRQASGAYEEYRGAGPDQMYQNPPPGNVGIARGY